MPNKRAGSNSVLWETLNSIQSTLGASDSDYSDMLGLTLPRFRNLKRDSKDVPLTAITELSKIVPTSLENIAMGKVDLKAIDAQLVKGNSQYLPDRYKLGALSKRRTSINLLYYVEQMHGYDYVKRFLKNFHVDYSIFAKEDENISLFFLQDITSQLLKVGYKQSHFLEIGKASTTTNRKGALGQAFQSCGSLSEMYVRLAKEFIPLLEDNFAYSIHNVTATGCVVRTHYKNSTKETLGSKTYGNLPICWTKVGLLGDLPRYRGLPEATIKKTKCLNQGDAYCEMHIHYGSHKLRRLL